MPICESTYRNFVNGVESKTNDIVKLFDPNLRVKIKRGNPADLPDTNQFIQHDAELYLADVTGAAGGRKRIAIISIHPTGWEIASEGYVSQFALALTKEAMKVVAGEIKRFTTEIEEALEKAGALARQILEGGAK